MNNTIFCGNNKNRQIYGIKQIKKLKTENSEIKYGLLLLSINYII